MKVLIFQNSVSSICNQSTISMALQISVIFLMQNLMRLTQKQLNMLNHILCRMVVGLSHRLRQNRIALTIVSLMNKYIY
ncbi:hypothetical protein CJ20_171 [Escherichia phage CJ20]|nr:hypothetical protein CJ20_171 [Escherichia phage CJ20]